MAMSPVAVSMDMLNRGRSNAISEHDEAQNDGSDASDLHAGKALKTMPFIEFQHSPPAFIGQCEGHATVILILPARPTKDRSSIQ